MTKLFIQNKYRTIHKDHTSKTYFYKKGGKNIDISNYFKNNGELKTKYLNLTKNNSEIQISNKLHTKDENNILNIKGGNNKLHTKDENHKLHTKVKNNKLLFPNFLFNLTKLKNQIKGGTIDSFKIDISTIDTNAFNNLPRSYKLFLLSTIAFYSGIVSNLIYDISSFNHLIVKNFEKYLSYHESKHQNEKSISSVVEWVKKLIKDSDNFEQLYYITPSVVPLLNSIIHSDYYKLILTTMEQNRNNRDTFKLVNFSTLLQQVEQVDTTSKISVDNLKTLFQQLQSSDIMDISRANFMQRREENIINSQEREQRMRDDLNK